MTKNTNYLVYVHLRKKQLEQNSCQTSRMTKNTNDLVMFIFIWLKLISLTCNCWKRKLPNDLKKLKLPQWPVKNWTFFISYWTPSTLSEAFVDSFYRNSNQKENYQMTWKNSNYSNDPLKNGHISSPIEPYLTSKSSPVIGQYD